MALPVTGEPIEHGEHHEQGAHAAMAEGDRDGPRLANLARRWAIRTDSPDLRAMVEVCDEMSESERGCEMLKKTTRAAPGPGGIVPAAPCVAAGILSIKLSLSGMTGSERSEVPRKR